MTHQAKPIPLTNKLIAVCLDRMKPHDQLQGVYVTTPNRPLTSNDVAGAKSILVNVNSDSQYPCFLKVDKDNFANIDTDNTHRITHWYFNWDDAQEGWIGMQTLSEPPKDTPYVLVIGTVLNICHIANGDDLAQAHQLLNSNNTTDPK